MTCMMEEATPTCHWFNNSVFVFLVSVHCSQCDGHIIWSIRWNSGSPAFWQSSNAFAVRGYGQGKIMQVSYLILQMG